MGAAPGAAVPGAAIKGDMLLFANQMAYQILAESLVASL